MGTFCHRIRQEVPMLYNNDAARDIEREMSAVLDGIQMKKLHECLERVMSEQSSKSPSNATLLRDFLNAKTVEGCSPRTIQYYSVTLGHFVSSRCDSPLCRGNRGGQRLSCFEGRIGKGEQRYTRQYPPHHIEFLFLARGRRDYLTKARLNASKRYVRSWL